MSEQTTQTEEVFVSEEIQRFDQDDGDFGRAICKMLSIFFFYTVIAMGGVAYWTFHAS